MAERTKRRDSSKGIKLKSPQERVIEFVEAYLLNFNATKAYSKVFERLADHSATAAASEYLRTDNVQQYLQKRLKERRKELHADQNYVVRKLLDIVETDYVDSIQYLTKEQIDKIPKEVRPLIQTIKVSKNSSYRTDSEGREFSNDSKTYEVTFMSKDKALELLGKHTGAFMKDNVQGQYDMGKMSFTDAMKSISEISDDD